MNKPSETKERIFDVFIEMASTLGYENITTRGIAKEIGIKAASIYNHFESKEKILEYTYDYYLKYQYDNRKSVDVMKKMMETASVQEIISVFFYTFVTEDQKKYRRMLLITKIIYMRIFQDPLANELFSKGNADNLEYVISVLKHGINIGRIKPDFDIETFADILIGSMMIMGINTFADTGYVAVQIEHEKRILALLARLLSTALLPETKKN